MFGLGVTIRGPRVYVLIGKHAHVPVVVSEEGGGGHVVPDWSYTKLLGISRVFVEKPSKAVLKLDGKLEFV